MPDEGSNQDVLLITAPNPLYFLFVDLKFYLEELLGREVDLVTDKALRPQVRRAIEQ
jgi:predicted nucleotidyltransferase